MQNNQYSFSNTSPTFFYYTQRNDRSPRPSTPQPALYTYQIQGKLKFLFQKIHVACSCILVCGKSLNVKNDNTLYLHSLIHQPYSHQNSDNGRQKLARSRNRFTCINRTGCWSVHITRLQSEDVVK